MKIALLGTGFGQAHAAVYAQRPEVDEVVAFGRTPEKLAKLGDQFGFATTTDLDAVITDASVDLVDICLPTRLRADVAVKAMQAGRDILIELPLATTGGWRATFTSAVLEYAMHADFTGQGPASLSEYTADGERAIELPDVSPYAAMIDHVLACLAGRADNRMEPASALPALELTLETDHRLAPGDRKSQAADSLRANVS
jgi:hypothetical protein